MRVEVNYSLQQEAEESAKSIGLNLGSLLAKPQVSAVGLPPYGGSYIYSLRIAERMRDIALSQAGRIHQPNAENWNKLLLQIVDLNCMWSIADSQVARS